MTDERWLPVPGWEGLYEVSDQGRVRSVDRWISYPNGSRRLHFGQLLVPQTAKRTEHVTVSLARNSRITRRSVHLLVMLAFVGPRPDGMDVCHDNGDPADNRLSNLRYGTHSENMYDAVRHGTHYESRRTHCPQKHLYDEANTRLYQGRRYCRACGEERSKARYRRG